MNETFHRLAAAGNVAALFILILFLANANVLLSPVSDRGSAATALPLPSPTGPPARNAILVIIDGLREDASRDREMMPFVNQLADAGGRGVATVESLIPSTIAGIVTIATGKVPAPVSFLSDFHAPAADDGGILRAIVEAGGACFVAGPRLWTDLYERWVAGSYADTLFDGDDASVLQATLGAVRSRSYRLVVVHFGGTDAAAHLHGGKSREYAAAVRRCDDAVRQLHDAAAPETCILVTSDHGVTDRGGHAGPEPHVLATPLVVSGPGMPTGQLPSMRQRDVHRLVTQAMAMPMPVPPTVAADARTPPLLLLVVSIAAGTLYCGARMASRLARPEPFRHRYVGGIHVTIWACLALLLVAGPAAALAAAGAVVLTYALAVRGGVGPAIVVAFIVGVTTGAARVADALQAVSIALPRLPTIIVCAGVFAAGLGVGACLRRSNTSYAAGVVAGAGAVFIVAVSGRLLGRTFSLSTIETHHAFHAADGPGGIPSAVAIVLAGEALPTLCLLAGLIPALRTLHPIASGGFASGAAAALVGQAVSCALALAAASPSHHALASVSTGGLLRVACETTYLFMLAALLSLRTAGGSSMGAASRT